MEDHKDRVEVGMFQMVCTLRQDLVFRGRLAHIQELVYDWNVTRVFGCEKLAVPARHGQPGCTRGLRCSLKRVFVFVVFGALETPCQSGRIQELEVWV